MGSGQVGPSETEAGKSFGISDGRKRKTAHREMPRQWSQVDCLFSITNVSNRYRHHWFHSLLGGDSHCSVDHYQLNLQMKKEKRVVIRPVRVYIEKATARFDRRRERQEKRKVLRLRRRLFFSLSSMTKHRLKFRRLLGGKRLEFAKLFKCFAAAIIVGISRIKSSSVNEGNANWRTLSRMRIVSVFAMLLVLPSSFSDAVRWINCGAFSCRYWIVVWMNKFCQEREREREKIDRTLAEVSPRTSWS